MWFPFSDAVIAWSYDGERRIGFGIFLNAANKKNHSFFFVSALAIELLLSRFIFLANSN